MTIKELPNYCRKHYCAKNMYDSIRAFCEHQDLCLEFFKKYSNIPQRYIYTKFPFKNNESKLIPQKEGTVYYIAWRYRQYITEKYLNQNKDKFTHSDNINEILKIYWLQSFFDDCDYGIFSYHIEDGWQHISNEMLYNNPYYQKSRDCYQ